MKGRFDLLDEQIAAAIAGGVDTYGALVSHGTLLADAKELATIDRWGGADGGRVIDRRLQVMRKAGRLIYSQRKWSLSAAWQAGNVASDEADARTPAQRDEGKTVSVPPGSDGTKTVRSAQPVVRELSIGSRHVYDYLLYNRADGTAWDAIEVGGADATWRAANPNPIAILIAHAQGRVMHLNRGSCPDEVEGFETRDPECPVCGALRALKSPASQEQESG